MELNTDQLYTDILEIKDGIESTMEFLKKDSGEYRYAKTTLKLLNNALEKCKKDLKKKDK